MLNTLLAAVEPVKAALIMPIDVVELVKAFNFTGMAALIASIGTLYAIIAANRSKRAETKAAAGLAKIETVSVQIDGLLTERDKAKVREGEAKEKIVGDNTAATLALGQEQGRAQAAAAVAPVEDADATQRKPLPVADDRTASGVERSAKAVEHLAAATTNVVAAIEDKK